jgi:hypothetical protein
MTTRKKTTSLWQLIDRMQRRLEDEGLDHEVVDVAVTRGLEAWLDTVPPLDTAHRRHGRFPLWCAPPLVSKA